MEREYIRKIADEKKFSPSDMMALNDAIWLGRILQDTYGRITVLHFDDLRKSRWYKVGVKVAKADGKFYFQTIHVSNPAQVRSLTKRMTLVRSKKN